jgi:hypothetical protein
MRLKIRGTPLTWNDSVQDRHNGETTASWPSANINYGGLMAG